ncbi:MAG: hypothetical protein ACPF9L_05470 [Candidatus Poseidoniaceae archaeon]
MNNQGKPEPIFIPAQQIIQDDGQNTNIEKRTQVIQGDVQNTNTEQQQEITYVDLKYKPEQNYRHLSYVVIILGVMIYFLSIMASSGTNSFGVFLGNVMCWLFFSAGLFLDAAFYKGRSEWQIANGQSNSESKTGMIVDIIVGIFGLWVAIFALVSFLE